MTMNTRQAGAFTELIKKEEAARARWEATHGVMFKSQQTQPPAAAVTTTTTTVQTTRQQTFGGTTAQPLNSTQRPQSARLYANGVTVGAPRLANEDDADFVKPQTVTKKVIRQVEVPTTRQVKVPVKTTQIVTEMVDRRVPFKKLVEYDDFTERDEVQRVRVPVKKFKEVEEWTTVKVPQQKAIQVDGVRVDEVNETKLVEVEEYQTFQLKPVPTGQPELIRTKELGTGRRLSGRVTGRNLYHAADPAVQHLANDSQPPSQRSSRPSSAQRYGATNGYLSQRSVTSQPIASSESRRLGFKVRTSTSQPGTCQVFDVEPGLLAARSGLKAGDIILSTNGRQTNTLQDFKNSVGASMGPILLQVRRGTDRFVITLQR